MRPELLGVLEEAAREEGLRPCHPGPPPRLMDSLRDPPSPRAHGVVQLLSSRRVLPPCPPACGTGNSHHPPPRALALCLHVPRAFTSLRVTLGSPVDTHLGCRAAKEAAEVTQASCFLVLSGKHLVLLWLWA